MAIDPLTRLELERVASEGLAHARAGTISKAEEIMELEAGLYTDPQRFRREIDRIFRRVPLMLAASCELPRPGCYKAVEAAGVPVLLTRGRDGSISAFLNACSHRGAMLKDGCGEAGRLVCPYHGWTFGLDGKLLGVASPQEFGEVDKSALGLVKLPAIERAGMVWVSLDPATALDIDLFLGAFGNMLAAFQLEKWHFVSSRELAGTNWKLALDAHPDWYHLPVLHRDSFGPETGNRTIFTSYGPHLRMFRPEPERPPPPEEHDLYRQQDSAPAQWTDESLLVGGWLVFPNVTMYPIYRNGRRYININQIIPGSDVGESRTVQITLAEQPLNEDTRREARAIADRIEAVVRDEDLPNSARQQRALSSGLLRTVRFGRNEAGNQHFHRWFERLVEAADDELAAAFSYADPVAEAIS